MIHALYAIAPIALVMIIMVAFNRTAKTAMALGWILICILAFFIWEMPLYWIAGASIKGILVATNILVIILGAIALYYTMQESGAIKRITNVITGLSPDRRIQASLAWLLAAFVEGIAGFGTPGALIAPLLVSIGFPARIAVPLVLIFNSTPVSFGAVGLPTFGGIGYTLDIPSINAAVAAVGMDYWHWINHTVTTAVASIHGIIGIFVPLLGVIFLVKWSGGKSKDILSAIPSTLAGGIAFVVPFFLIASLMGPELASALAAVIGLLIYALILKAGFFKFGNVYKFQGETRIDLNEHQQSASSYGVLKAFIPYILISLILVCTRIVPPLNEYCSTKGIVTWSNILGTSTSFAFQSMWNPGIYFIIVVLITHYIFRMSGPKIKNTWKNTFCSIAPAAVALWFAVALSQIMILSGNNLSNMDSMVSIIAKAATVVMGEMYVIISPFIGVLGAYIAGSNTVSNIMMVGFQYETAKLLNISRTIIVALQDIGGAVGNMICVHNVVAVCATVGIIGKEGSVIRRNLLPCILYALIAGIIGYIAIIVFPGLF
ncbi:L-lactate permease [Chloroflexota bacterium]